MFKHLIGMALAAMILTPQLAAAAPGFANRNVNVRSGPGLNFEVVDTLVSNEPVDIGNCNQDRSWCYIRHEGTNGWVAAVFLTETTPQPPQQPQPPQPPQTGGSDDYVATNNVNIRSGPGTQFSIVDRLDANEQVTRGQCVSDGAWCYVTHTGPDGWVSSSYLAPANPPAPPQQPTPPASGKYYAKSNVNIRSGPGLDFGIVDRLQANERVARGQCSPDGTWCYVNQDDDGPSGWVSAAYLAPVISPPPPAGGTPPGGGTGNLNKIGTAIANVTVRSQPTLFAPVVGRMNKGDSLPVDRCNANQSWCHLTANSYDGWVFAAFLTLEDAPQPPATEVVATRRVFVRSQPNFGDNVVGLLHQGDRASLLTCNNTGDWCKVTSNNTTGWLPANALDVPEDVPAPPATPQQPNSICFTGIGGIRICLEGQQ